MNQLAQLHLRLFPRWTTSGKATTRDSSAGKVSFFALEFSANRAFSLHSSQSVITAITRNLLHFKPSARQVLQALNEGMCEVWPFSMQFAHTDLVAKHSLQLLKHEDASYDTSFALSIARIFVLSWRSSEWTVTFPRQRQTSVDTKLQRELKYRCQGSWLKLLQR